MNPNKLSLKENQAMRKRYGSWVAGMLAALMLLIGVQSAQAVSTVKYYPTLSLRNWNINRDGIQRVPTPGPGGDRYFLVPIYIYNEVDTTFNPNVGGQHLEPIRSFEFQMTYLTQAMVLDTLHGSPIVVVGPDPNAPPALAKTFFTRYSDQQDVASGNQFQHRIRVSGAGSVPLPLANTSDSGASAGENGILMWLRFKVVLSNVNAGLIQLDTSLFNDHRGDSLLNSPGSPSFDYTHGNFGGGSGVGGNQNKGQGLVQITAQPAFILTPFSQISPTDGSNANFQLMVDLLYDPTNPTAVTRSIQLSDAVGNTELDNVNVCSNQAWLNVSSSPGGSTTPAQCTFISKIDYTSSFGSQQKNILLTVNPASLQAGIYYATVTFTSDGASNSPTKLLVRFIRLANPNEPGMAGTSATGNGIRLNISNSCNPVCTNVLTFGTGPLATNGLDLIYGEQPFTTNDRTTADTNVVVSSRCSAYFVPRDSNAFALQRQDPTFLGITRDIRPDKTDTALIYQVHFSAGDPNCYPVKVCVDPNDFPAGGRIFMSFTQNGLDQGIDLRNATLDNNNMRCVTISDRRINTFYIQYTPGTVGVIPPFTLNSWNLVSLPVIPPNTSRKVIFPDAAGVPYMYYGGWAQAEDLEYGRGYMIKYGNFAGTNNLVAGTRTSQINNLRILQGWNTVGATSFATSANNIFLTPLAGQTKIPNLVSDVWEFVPQHGYSQTTFLVPGRGYFIKVDQDGYYNVNASSSDVKHDFGGKAAMEKTAALEGSLSKINVSDAHQNGQDLYFGNATTTLNESRFEMPPTVPELDARFVSNHGMISFNKKSYSVSLKSQNYPLTMNFSNLQGDVDVRDMSGNLLGAVSNGGSITITDASIQNVEISQKETTTVPNVAAVTLDQNVPNPFFPVTTISFSIPAEMPVTLVVYNTLGEVVQTVLSETMSAGPHQAMFDGANLPAGNYFYTLKAGNFVKTVHMQLNK